MKKIKLKDICNISAGGTPSRSNINYWNNGDIPWCKIGDFSGKYINQVKENITEEGLKNSSAKIFKRGTILYTIFATVGEVAILEKESATNQAIAGLELINNEVDLEYLYYYLKSLKFLMLKKSRGVAQNNINLGILKNIEIKIPDKIEQINIAKILGNIERIIDKKKKQLKELNTIIKSQFVEMFELEKYELEMLGGISNFIDYRGKTPTISDDKEVRIVNAKSVGKGFFKYIDEYITEDLYEKWMKRGVAYAGDVLFVTEGHTFGNTCLIPDGIERFALGQRVITIQGKEKLNNIYLCYYMQLDEFINKINIYKTGGTAKGIRSKDLAKITIPVPPITLQNEFSEIVKRIDKQKFESMIQLKMIEKIYNIINDRRRYV